VSYIRARNVTLIGPWPWKCDEFQHMWRVCDE